MWPQASWGGRSLRKQSSRGRDSTKVTEWESPRYGTCLWHVEAGRGQGRGDGNGGPSSWGAYTASHLPCLGAQQAASRMEATGWQMAWSLGATLLGPLFPQRAALWPEPCHIFVISCQVRGDAHMTGGRAPCCSPQRLGREPEPPDEGTSGSAVSFLKSTGNTSVSALLTLGNGKQGSLDPGAWPGCVALGLTAFPAGPPWRQLSTGIEIVTETPLQGVRQCP